MSTINKIIVTSLAILLICISNIYSAIDVYVDPGHGGFQSGTVSSFYPTLYPSLYEKVVNLEVALKFVHVFSPYSF